MIKYYCDHCGKEIRALNNLREIDYGWSQVGCDKKYTKAVVHARCMVRLTKYLKEYLPTVKVYEETGK